MALGVKIVSSLLRRVFGSKLKTSEDLNTSDDFQSLLIRKGDFERTNDNSKLKIILLGPYHFKQPMWSVRASSAIPDLIAPLRPIAQVHLVTPIPNSEAAASINQLVEEHGIYHHLLPPNFNLKNLIEKGRLLDEVVGSIKPQIIMNTFGVIASGFDAVTCARRNAITSILRVPGNEIFAHEKMGETNSASDSDLSQNKINSNKENFAIMNADKVIVMSNKEADRITETRGTDGGISIQIRGVDTALFKSKKDNESSKILDNDRPINIGFVGRLTKEKGTDILLQVMDELKVNSKVVFHIASPESIEDKIIQQNLNLCWHGYVSHNDMPAFMDELDLLILPSHTEGLSQTMMEAMSSGLPVLLQKHIHPDCLPGMVHCDGSASSFSKTIEMLELDRNKLAKLSKAARKTATKSFDKNIWSDKMTKLFQHTLKDQ